MKIAVLRETQAGETRVAATPDTVKRLIGFGAGLVVEPGAGLGAGIADADYVTAGATLAPDPAAGADIVLAVRRPEPARLAGANPGALLIGTLDPHSAETALSGLAAIGISAFAMELMPRITRAQTMDVLSSQANLAGYQAIIEAAAAFGRAMPQMMTAAGTVRPAKVFVMGAGVAGLQAIATARRLGAIVSATDVRAAAGEQVASLGAKFVMTDALKDASGTGGYARELTPDEQAAQAALVAEHIARQDIVVTTALIPGRPAPRLVTRAMIESMAPGSVVVDLAAERGGNVELTVRDAVIVHNGVTVIGHTNLAGRIAATASQLYARNLFAFVETLIDRTSGALAVDWDDDLVKATLLTRDGTVVHPAFAAAPPERKPEPKPAARKAAPRAEALIKTGAASKSGTSKRAAARTPDKPVAEAPIKTGATGKTAAVKKPAKAKTPAARKAPAAKPATNKDGGK
jgi:NAD(P) transhydrogenase subunit alpha